MLYLNFKFKTCIQNNTKNIDYNMILFFSLSDHLLGFNF